MVYQLSRLYVFLNSVEQFGPVQEFWKSARQIENTKMQK